jgi:triacylglycerol lipase
MKAAAPVECVILLHGLGRTSRSMQTLQRALEQSGYVVANIGYPSRKFPVEQLATGAVERGLAACRKQGASRIHFVTHSLGGILVRYYMRDHDVPELGRVVMLAPPNQGSEVVDAFSRVPGFAAITGPAGLQLGTDPAALPNALGPVTFPVGVIAGTGSINPVFSALHRGENDGTVSVARAGVEGMSDFVRVRASHTFIMRNAQAIRQTLAFLEAGRFRREADEPKAPSLR